MVCTSDAVTWFPQVRNKSISRALAAPLTSPSNAALTERAAAPIGVDSPRRSPTTGRTPGGSVAPAREHVDAAAPFATDSPSMHVSVLAAISARTGLSPTGDATVAVVPRGRIIVPALSPREAARRDVVGQGALAVSGGRKSNAVATTAAVGMASSEGAVVLGLSSNRASTVAHGTAIMSAVLSETPSREIAGLGVPTAVPAAVVPVHVARFSTAVRADVPTPCSASDGRTADVSSDSENEVEHFSKAAAGESPVSHALALQQDEKLARLSVNEDHRSSNVSAAAAAAAAMVSGVSTRPAPLDLTSLSPPVARARCAAVRYSR